LGIGWRAAGKSEWSGSHDETVLLTSSVTRSIGSLPAQCAYGALRGIAVKVVVAIAGLSDTVGATDDDVRGQGFADAEGSIWHICRADRLKGGIVVGDLRRGKSS
jgi:membrane-bound ClpP family serine protease